MPEGARVALGPYRRIVDGPFKFEIDLTRLDAKGESTQTFRVEGESIQVASVTGTAEGIDILFVNKSGEGRSITFDPDASIVVSDDDGGEFRSLGYSFDYPVDSTGASSPNTLTLSLAGKLSEDATRLYVEISSLGKFDYGPTIELPKVEPGASS